MPLELDLSALPNCKGSFTPRSIALSLFFALFVSSLRTAFNQWIPKSLAEDRLYKGASAGPWPAGCCLRGILCGSQWCSQGGWVYGEVGVWVNWAEDEPPAIQHPRGSLLQCQAAISKLQYMLAVLAPLLPLPLPKAQNALWELFSLS